MSLSWYGRHLAWRDRMEYRCELDFVIKLQWRHATDTVYGPTGLAVSWQNKFRPSQQTPTVFRCSLSSFISRWMQIFFFLRRQYRPAGNRRNLIVSIPTITSTRRLPRGLLGAGYPSGEAAASCPRLRRGSARLVDSRLAATPLCTVGGENVWVGIGFQSLFPE